MSQQAAYVLFSSSSVAAARSIATINPPTADFCSMFLNHTMYTFRRFIQCLNCCFRDGGSKVDIITENDTTTSAIMPIRQCSVSCTGIIGKSLKMLDLKLWYRKMQDLWGTTYIHTCTFIQLDCHEECCKLLQPGRNVISLIRFWAHEVSLLNGGIEGLGPPTLNPPVWV